MLRLRRESSANPRYQQNVPLTSWTETSTSLRVPSLSHSQSGSFFRAVTPIDGRATRHVGLIGLHTPSPFQLSLCMLVLVTHEATYIDLDNPGVLCRELCAKMRCRRVLAAMQAAACRLRRERHLRKDCQDLLVLNCKSGRKCGRTSDTLGSEPAATIPNEARGLKPLPPCLCQPRMITSQTTRPPSLWHHSQLLSTPNCQQSTSQVFCEVSIKRLGEAGASRTWSFGASDRAGQTSENPLKNNNTHPLNPKTLNPKA